MMMIIFLSVSLLLTKEKSCDGDLVYFFLRLHFFLDVLLFFSRMLLLLEIVFLDVNRKWLESLVMTGDWLWYSSLTNTKFASSSSLITSYLFVWSYFCEWNESGKVNFSASSSSSSSSSSPSSCQRNFRLCNLFSHEIRKRLVFFSLDVLFFGVKSGRQRKAEKREQQIKEAHHKTRS